MEGCALSTIEMSQHFVKQAPGHNHNQTVNDGCDVVQKVQHSHSCRLMAL